MAYDANTVYTSLTSRGLPQNSITLDDFLRVYGHGGPLQDAILFISEHLRGREGVNEARRRLLYKLQPKLTKRSEHPERPPADIAFSRLAKAKKDMEIYSNMIQDKTKSMEKTQKQITTLKYQLSSQRRVDLLLEILAKKEQERIKRFEEISRSLVDLKQKQLHPFRNPKLPLAQSFESEPSVSKSIARLDLNLKKPRHTQDALIALNAYHVRLARLAAQSTRPTQDPQITQPRAQSHLHPPSFGAGLSTRRAPSIGVNKITKGSVLNAAATAPTVAAEAQLRSLVARKLGVDGTEDDPEVERVFQGFIKVAKARARNQVRYTGSVNSVRKPISTKELDRLAAEVNRKTAALQDAFNLSVDMVHGADEAFISLTNFRATTIPSLQESLNSQAQSIRGYIDHLRVHIVNSEDIENSERRIVHFKSQATQLKSSVKVNEPEFDREVRKILELSETVTSEKVLEETGRLIRYIRLKSQYLEAIPRPSSSPAREAEILTYESQKHQIEDATETLLTRKIDKAESLGSGLVQDIEVLLKEVKTVVGHGKVK
ncbi:hypothetical protein J3R30DRAFT_3406356 [Lentinula aciculospora]|uniref:Uncharacterized protein n=1 Tax=Lentinula aciculospora TaxID=153920 RepID=A0A9W9A4N0_9AGAR|nr:hypothetical protein J3R30DRAFT_3406356 [Lentinula aciculospora]